MLLPRPCLSFTLPSTHDDTRLDCRVYHPPCLRERDPSPQPGAPSWEGHAAVVAHPYAPMGGCFDDAVVDVVAGTLLRGGFVVATFNFRGAGSSAGRTSWTSRPEQADYISVVGFLAYYVYHLDPMRFIRPTSANVPPTNTGANADRRQSTPAPTSPTMLLAGYSYGAMITTRLPPLESILSHFATPAIHTAEADIRLRAQHLAEAYAAASSPASPRKSLGVRVGGDEDPSRRRSQSCDFGAGERAHQQRAMFEFLREEKIRESVRGLLARAQLVHRRATEHGGDEHGQMHQCLERVEGDVVFRSAYLAVSPPVGFVTRLATMSFFSGSSTSSSSATAVGEDGTTGLFTTNPALVVYGDKDGFISYRKMREWVRQLEGAENSGFRYVEVRGAGHFWAEGDVVYQLRDAIGRFATELVHEERYPGLHYIDEADKDLV